MTDGAMASAVATGTWRPCWSFMVPDACWDLKVSTMDLVSAASCLPFLLKAGPKLE